MNKLKKTNIIAIITCISIAVSYLEARFAVVVGHIDGVKDVISEAAETIEQFKQLGEQLDDLQSEEFLFPLPAVPVPESDSDWIPRAPDPPPLEPFPDPIGGSRAGLTTIH